MGNEELEAVKKQLAAMKKIELTGFTNTETATAYFQEKEAILEGIVKTLETVAVQERAEVEALKSTVKSLRDELKGQAANPRELSRRELLYNLGKGIAAAWAGNHKALANLSFSPNLKADNWTNPKDVSWGEKGWNLTGGQAAEKAALGSPIGIINFIKNIKRILFYTYWSFPFWCYCSFYYLYTIKSKNLSSLGL
jgi:hypothetical protein